MSLNPDTVVETWLQLAGADRRADARAGPSAVGIRLATTFVRSRRRTVRRDAMAAYAPLHRRLSRAVALAHCMRVDRRPRSAHARAVVRLCRFRGGSASSLRCRSQLDWARGFAVVRAGGAVAVAACGSTRDRMLVDHRPATVARSVAASCADTYVGARSDDARVAAATARGGDPRTPSCVLPDMLPPEDFRRLRVLLRYGRERARRRAGSGEPGLSVDERSALALRLSRDEVEIERHQRFRRRQRARSSAGCVWPRSGERIGPGTTALMRRFGALLPLVGELARKRRRRRPWSPRSRPSRRAAPGRGVEREHDRRIRRAFKQRHQCARQPHRRGDVHAQQRQPAVERLVLDRPERAEERSRVHQRVEPSELRLAARRRRWRNRRPPPWPDRAAGSPARGGPPPRISS